MRRLMTTVQPEAVERRFYSVAEAAGILGVSEMTVYRAIRLSQFPAVQLMGRLIVPKRVIDEMIEAATNTGALVNTEDWVAPTG